MDTIKRLWWLAFPGGYVVVGAVFTVVIFVNGGPRPIIGGLFWPIRLIRILFGDMGE